MKNPIKNGIMALLASATLLATQPAEGQHQPGSNPKQIQPDKADSGPVLNVNFPGGTLDAYILALQEAAGGKPVNVVAPTEAKKVVLPPIMLRAVTAYTALSVIRSAFEDNSEHRFDIGYVGNQEDATFAVQYIRVDRGGARVPGQPAPKRLEVYSIRDLIEPPAGVDGTPQAKVAYESILSAVDAAMGMFEEKDPPKLMFHKETGLLLVGGTPYQTEVVDNLIRRIRDDLQRRWSEERTTKKQSAEQQRRVQMARTELQIAEKELVLAEEQLARTNARAEGGLASKEEVAQATINVDRARAMLERRKIELDGANESAEAAAPVRMVVVYDISGIPANAGVVGQVSEIAQKGGGKAQLVSGDGGSASSIVVTADEATHAAARQILESARKRTQPSGK